MQGKPRIPLNDYGVLGPPPRLGEWRPTLAVSVVIPAYRAEATLPLTLASLAHQSYPAHLLEVIVVDDGDEPLGPLPGPVPERLRVIRRPPGTWGKANACAIGAEAADGDVVHFVDADLVLFPEHIEAHMRWHHLADYLVVLGRVRFTPGLDETPAGEVLAAIEAGALAKLYAEEDTVPQWTERHWDESADLRTAGLRAFHVTVGATTSLPAELLRTAGGVDRALVLGEDTELGYRLAQQGAVFVAERAARCWHLGPSTVMRREREVKRHNWPYLAERVPTFRWLRRHPARSHLVPYVEVVVPVGNASFEAVRATVDGVLAARPADLTVTIAGPWGRLRDGRRDPLGDPDLDLRLIRACYAGEARVAFQESVSGSAFPAPFRLHCPPGWVPARHTVASLIKHADRHGLGLICVALEERGARIVHARLERTAAVNRARRCAGPHDRIDDLVHEMFGSVWTAGETWGFTRAGAAVPPPRARRPRRGRRDAPTGGALRRTTTRLRRRLRALVRPAAR